jgi:hypothetical protein
MTQQPNALHPTCYSGLRPLSQAGELFAQTPWYMPPVSVPLDFVQSDDEIYKLTQAMVEATPKHMKREEWRAHLQRRLTQEGTIEQRAPLSEERTPPGAEKPRRPTQR